MKHSLKTKLYKNKIYIFIGFLIVTFVVLQCANIFLANTLDSKSIYVSRLQDQVTQIEQENLILKSQVLDLTSFESIASRAGALGFSPEKDFVSLYSPSVALGK